MSNPTNQMVTHGQKKPPCEDKPSASDIALSEIIACLMKYQDMCRNAPWARKVWKRANKALQTFSKKK